MQGRDALYYPFHLCSPESLERFLARYDTLHFRDYMAIQLTPMSGTIAAPDRMGDTYPQLLEQGRIAQGHNVSGSFTAEMDARIDRDFKDRDWREIFQLALRHEPRFRRGLAEQGNEQILAPWTPERWIAWAVTIADLRRMSCLKLDPVQAEALEYGLMLLKTSSSLWYTVMLCQRYALEAATDSPAHERLLRRTMVRDGLELQTFLSKSGGE
jgi:hypothetical protein